MQTNGATATAAKPPEKKTNVSKAPKPKGTPQEVVVLMMGEHDSDENSLGWFPNTSTARRVVKNLVEKHRASSRFKTIPRPPLDDDAHKTYRVMLVIEETRTWDDGKREPEVELKKCNYYMPGTFKNESHAWGLYTKVRDLIACVSSWDERELLSRTRY